MDRNLTLVLAHGPDGVIGDHGGLPWPRHREDMRRFKEATLGGTLIMGRKTYDSIGRRPLPWRHNVVITSRPENISGNAVAVRDLRSALQTGDKTTLFVIGGATIYAAAMPYARRILLTEMKGDFKGDVFFKIPYLHQWREVSREEWRGDDGDCDFVEYRLD